MMQWLRHILQSLISVHFCPDNHATPIRRLGRYHRVGEPGFFFTLPLIERTQPAIKTSLFVGDFLFEEVLSQDNIPFTLKLTILFSFTPQAAHRDAAAVLVNLDEAVLKLIMHDYASQGLRQLTARFIANDLSSDLARSTIERNLNRFLRAQARPLGLAPLKQGGVILKEVIGHEKFRRAMLDAKRMEANLQIFASYQAVGDLINQAIQAGLVTGLEDMKGNLTLLSTMAPLEQMDSIKPLDFLNHLPKQNGHYGYNGNN